MANHELGVECFCFECLRKRGAQPSSTIKAEGGRIEKFVGRRDAAESEQNKAGTTSDEGKSNVLRSEADDQSPSLSNERPTPKPPKPSVQGPEEPLGMRHWWEQYWAENRSGKAPTGDIGCGEAFLFASWFAAQAREFEADYARANSPSPAITEKAVEDIATRINGCWALHIDTGTFARPTEKVIAKFLADRLREAGVRVE